MEQQLWEEYAQSMLYVCLKVTHRILCNERIKEACEGAHGRAWCSEFNPWDHVRVERKN